MFRTLFESNEIDGYLYNTSVQSNEDDESLDNTALVIIGPQIKKLKTKFFKFIPFKIEKFEDKYIIVYKKVIYRMCTALIDAYKFVDLRVGSLRP